MPDAQIPATAGAPAPGTPGFATPQRSALLSVYQSAAREHPGADAGFRYAASRVAAARLGPDNVPADAPAGIADDIWNCARLGLAWLEAHVTGDAAAARLRDTLKGSDCDPRWLEALERHLVYFGADGHRRAVPYRRPAVVGDPVLPLKAGARIALISDWGLGTEAADRVLRQAAALRPDVLIHLGDVYYSGTAVEYELDFRRPIAARLGEDGSRIPVYILSGNHDMYSGGEAYYAMIDRLNPEPLRQRASWFCLRSADQAWQILAMDTGLHDHDPLTAVGSAVQTFVEPEEVAWHAARIREFPGRSILLSHHPLFSAFQQLRPREPDGSLLPVNQSLLDGFAPLLAEGRIAAWFWGHEHALAIYQPFAGLARGRCVGNGAIPVAISDDPYRSPDRLRDRPALLPGVTPGRDGPIYAHGCALLDLGTEARVEFYQTTQSTPLYGERLDDGTPPGPPGPDIAGTNIS